MRDQKTWSQRLIRGKLLPLASDDSAQKNKKLDEILSYHIPYVSEFNDITPLGCGAFGITLRWRHRNTVSEEWVDEVVKMPIYHIDTPDEGEIIDKIHKTAERTRNEYCAQKTAAKAHVCGFPRSLSLGPIMCIISPYAG